MKVEQHKSMNAYELRDRCRRASEILVSHETRRRFPNGYDAITADAIVPVPPTTRAAATPHILLKGPFEGEPDLTAIAIYAGIGIIEIHDTHDIAGADCIYVFRPIGPVDDEGIEARNAYLQAAFHLYYNDVTLVQAARS